MNRVASKKTDAVGLLHKILEADVTVYASPVYCFDFTAQLKSLIDRHFCLLYKPLMDGKTSGFAAYLLRGCGT